ncbi:hypothetical protein [Photobacterium sp. R1]
MKEHIFKSRSENIKEFVYDDINNIILKIRLNPIIIKKFDFLGGKYIERLDEINDIGNADTSYFTDRELTSYLPYFIYLENITNSLIDKLNEIEFIFGSEIDHLSSQNQLKDAGDFKLRKELSISLKKELKDLVSHISRIVKNITVISISTSNTDHINKKTRIEEIDSLTKESIEKIQFHTKSHIDKLEDVNNKILDDMNDLISMYKRETVENIRLLEK